MIKIIGLFVGVALLSVCAGWGLGTFVLNPDSAHAEEVAVDEHGNPIDAAHAEEEKPEIVVEIGKLMVPVYKPKSITYVVAEMGLVVNDEKIAEKLKEEKELTDVKNEVLMTLVKLSETGVMSGAQLDADQIAMAVREKLKSEYERDIADVLFINLVKQDVARG